jgi:hypothetical protein
MRPRTYERGKWDADDARLAARAATRLAIAEDLVRQAIHGDPDNARHGDKIADEIAEWRLSIEEAIRGSDA